ncbi:hypothetical protein GCM10023084_32660 [Streptomyces lacrimifluminis]|uniref:ABC transporter domain-containing protein n=1 Tax=Streptomyces lacrimifluminis TaxID=1500077 RepID=A0A917KVI6_9ACTN|nr:hypothetical protein GCM10012282_31040 [Streptomyces lacrimifluminis]
MPVDIPTPVDTPTPVGTHSELVRLDRVTKRFGEQTVLDRLSLSVEAGRHVTLIGPSGSGKTTILRLLMTLAKPDEGTITVDGQALFPAPEKQVREVRKKIGMVFQHFNLFPNMSVLRNTPRRPSPSSACPRTRRTRAGVSCWSWWASRTSATNVRPGCRAVSSSGWRSRGRWPCARGCCCSTR